MALEATADSENVPVSPLTSVTPPEKVKVFDVPGGSGELGAAIDAVSSDCPVSVIEVKIPGVEAERLIELIVMVAPLLLVTEKAPAFDMLDPAATVIATDDVTATLICARATPATPTKQKATAPIKPNLSPRFTALPPSRQQVVEFPTIRGANENNCKRLLA
ncbi:MAG TPA: hypothetical protein VGY99_00515 [Candidatus Binataceae bacterium]|nr:hypothetical protein [Candidatus Binataceae bacterium]